MRASLISSVVLHAALLGFGLISLSSPRSMEVADVEALPVDIVPVEEMSQIQQGDRTAPLAERPAPLPTQRPDEVADARQVGDNDVDTTQPPTPEPRPRPVESADSAKLQPEPVEKPKEDVVETEEPQPVPATEVAPIPTPRQEVTPDPVKTADVRPQPRPEPQQPQDDAIEKAIAAEEAKIAKEMEARKAEEERAQAEAEAKAQAEKEAAEKAAAEKKAAEEKAVQEKAAAEKAARDKAAAEARTAKAPERKNSEKPAREASSRPRSTDEGALEDEVAALLSKEKSAGGGAKRSTQQAALGGKKDRGGQKLTQSELDALRGKIQQCWNVPAGAADGGDLRVSITFRLTPEGEIDGRPEIISGGGSTGIERAAAESARRAVLKCAPYNLPAEKYEGGWDKVTVNFDPSDMF